MENFATGKVDKYDFCHALVESTVKIVAKRVEARSLAKALTQPTPTYSPGTLLSGVD